MKIEKSRDEGDWDLTVDGFLKSTWLYMKMDMVKSSSSGRSQRINRLDNL